MCQQAHRRLGYRFKRRNSADCAAASALSEAGFEAQPEADVPVAEARECLGGDEVYRGSEHQDR